MALLNVQNVTKAFGGLLAVDDATLAVEEGSITGLIGPNGAGKTTMFNVLSGYYTPTDGEITFAGESIGGLPAHQICRKGLVRTFQLARGLNQMTVLENMMLAAPAQSGEQLVQALFRSKKMLAQERENYDYAVHLLHTLGLHDKRNELAGSLSGGQRKMLEVGRALMSRPRLLLLDEPAAGASSEETKQLMAYLMRVRDEGMTLFIVEHKMDVIMPLCDMIVVMNFGRILTAGTPAQIQKDQQVIAAYLGTELAEV
ncbi:MAG: ABC transporter ATP-binding protein [Chloroflexi bacterium]|nr:MAG: ABC transporter ATP-binding protein [Chloroflexota bacterium]